MSRTLIQNASSENVSDSGGASSESISQEAPSLQKLCILEIARYVERFPPDAIGDYLTPEHWDEVVRCKHAQTQPIKASGGIDGVGRKNPAISLDTMNNVENKCPGLVSKVSDLLIWKDLVECNFRKGTHKRPEILSKPRPVILRILKDAKDSLTEFMVTFERGCNSQHSLSDIEDDGVTPNKWHQQLSKSYVSLAAAHITVDLLKESGIGKIIKTFTKKGEKIDSGSYDGPLSAMGSIWTSSLKRFTPLLEKWMNIAARGGVEIKQSNKISRSSSSSMSSIGVISGKYTQEDYEEDVEAFGACDSWKALYLALAAREKKRLVRAADKVRETSNNMRQNRSVVRKVGIRRNVISTAKRADRMESILSGDRGQRTTRGNTNSIAFAAQTNMNKLRRETKAVQKYQKSSATGARLGNMSFGNSVGNANITSGNKRVGGLVTSYHGTKKHRINK